MEPSRAYRMYQLPTVLDYREGRPIPNGYHVEERYRKGFIGTGAGLFGGIYLLTVLVSSAVQDASGDSSVAALYVPVIGPLIGMGTMEVGYTAGMVLTLNTIGQGTGLGLLIAGLVRKKKVLVADFADMRFELRPEIGPQRQGIGLNVTF